MKSFCPGPSGQDRPATCIRRALLSNDLPMSDSLVLFAPWDFQRFGRPGWPFPAQDRIGAKNCLFDTGFAEVAHERKNQNFIKLWNCWSI